MDGVKPRWYERPIVWFWVVLLVGATLRVIGLGTWDMWTDEVNTLWTAAYGEWISGPMYRSAPLNFLLARWMVGWLGPNETAIRIVPFACGVLSVALTFVLVKRWIGARAAVFAEMAMALSVWHIYWSQTARHFSLQLLLILLALHFFLHFWIDGRSWGLAASVASILGALFTHSSASFYLAAFLAFVTCDWAWSRFERGIRSAWSAEDRRHLIAGLAYLATFLAYLPIYVQVGSYTLAHRLPWNPPWNVAGSLVFYVPPYVALPALAGAVLLLRGRRDLAVLLLAMIVIPPMLVTFASTITIASGSYCVASMIAVATLIGVAADRVLDWADRGWERWAVAVLLGGIFAAQAYDCALYETFYHGLKPRWRELSEVVRSRRGPGELVLADEGDVVQFYLGRGKANWLDEYQAGIGGEGFPPPEVRGVWYGIYLTDSEITRRDARTLGYILENSRLVRLFPLSYGPKDRTLALFHQEVHGRPASAP